MGEPRLSYEMIKDAGELNTLINACWIDPETLAHSPLFQVKTDALQFITKEDNDFGDTIHENVKTFNTLGEYSHLLYTFGKTAINFIAALILEINSKGERKPVSTEFAVLYYQLHSALEASWNDLSFLFGTKKSNEDNFDFQTDKLLVDFRNIYSFTMGLYEDIKGKDHWCELGEILAALYGALASLLIGLTLKLTNNSIIDPGKLFNTDEDISKATINAFANAFMSNETIDATTKNRYISLLIFFYKLHEFYRIYNGIQIDDPMIVPVVSLGEEFASLPEEQLVENIDLSILTQGDLEIHSSKTFESFLSYENFISSPATYYINCLDYDTANKVIIARAITFLFKYNSIDIDETLRNKYKPAYYSLIEESGENITDEGKILGLYDFFINNVVGKVLKNTCDVKLYHLVTMCAIHFKYLTKQNLSKELTEYVYGGLYQAEALMVFLWHDWFQSGKTYKVEKNIHCADNKALGLLYKAKQYVKIDLIHYLQAAFEIQSPSFYTEDKPKYDYTRDFYQTISVYHMSLLANKHDYNLNTIYQLADMGKTTITEGSDEFSVNTGLDTILPHISDKNYNASIEEKAESDDKKRNKSYIIAKRLINIKKNNVTDIDDGTSWRMLRDKKIFYFDPKNMKIEYTPNLLKRLLQFKNDQIAPRNLYGSSKKDIDISVPIIINQIFSNQKLHPIINLDVNFLLDEVLMHIYLAHTSVKTGNKETEINNRIVYTILINEKNSNGIILVVLNYSHKGKKSKMITDKEDYKFIKEGILQFLALPENIKWKIDDFVRPEVRTLNDKSK